MSSCDPFGPIEFPNSQAQQKRPPPPRPPPPRCQQQGSLKNISIFGRRKTQKPPATAIVRPLPPSVNVPTGTLIDLQSPTQSIFSDPKKPNVIGGSSSSLSSHVESGFEDDFGSILSSGSTSPWGDQYSSTSDWTSPCSAPSPDLKDPFTPLPAGKLRTAPKVPAPARQPAPAKQPPQSRGQWAPTIICVQPTSKPKPMRPPPPKVNQPPPDGSPPMPSVPPPPPPLDILAAAPIVPPRPHPSNSQVKEEPCCVATYDYDSDHPDDLSMKEGDVILRIQRINEEWMKGELNGRVGLFPSSYVHIKVPPKEEDSLKVICTYPYTAETWDDLSLKEGDIISVSKRINSDWLYGACDGKKGQFPANFVQDLSQLDIH